MIFVKNLKFLWSLFFFRIGLGVRFDDVVDKKQNFPYFAWNKKRKNCQFFDQNDRLTPLEKSYFFDFFGFFYSPHRRFFFIEYREKAFPALFRLKPKYGKFASFWSKPWTNPFRKISTCSYSLERPFFFIEYRWTHFPGLFWLK